MNLSFAGCGFLGIYHVGVAVCFKKYAPHLLLGKISGASFGALSACCLLCDLPIGEITTDVLRVVRDARAGSLGPFSPSFNIQNVLFEGMQRYLPHDVHKIVSGKLHISLTRVYDGKNVIVSEFATREDLLQAILATCFVPVFSGMLPPRFHGIRYMDGGFSDNLPILDENTVTVSPFCGESDICPRDLSSQLFHVNVSNTSIELSKQNMNRFARILFPPNPEVLSNMCKQGFDDALRFLQRNNLISCTRCLAVQSTFHLQDVLDDTTYDFDPDCEECKTHRQDALVDDLPDTVMTIFQNAIDSANSGIVNWVMRRRAVRYLTVLALPYTVPIDILYATFTNYHAGKVEKHAVQYKVAVNILVRRRKCLRHNNVMTRFVSCTPKMSKSLWKLSRNLLEQLHGFVYTAQDRSVAAAKIYYKIMDAKKDLHDGYQMERRRASQFKLTCGEKHITYDDTDTFDHILSVTSHNDALLAYYYLDSENKMKMTEIYDVTDADTEAVQSPTERDINKQLEFENDWSTEFIADSSDDLDTEAMDDDALADRNIFSDPESEWNRRSPTTSESDAEQPESDRRTPISAMVGKGVEPKTSRIFHQCYVKCCKLQNLTPLNNVIPSGNGKVLDFCVDRIKYVDWPPILNALSCDLSLHSVSIRCRQPVKTVLEQIDCERLAKTVNKRAVILTNFMLTNLMEAISQLLSNTTLLTTLLLEGLPLKIPYLNPLNEGLLANNSLQHLYLPRCLIGDAGCLAVCKAVRCLPNILTLDLTGCDLTPLGASYIADLVKYQKIHRYSENWIHTLRYRLPELDAMAGLRRITLCANPQLGDVGVSKLLDVMADDLWIKALDIQNCGVSEQTSSVTLKMLQSNTTLVILDMRHNPDVMMESLSKIRAALRENERGMGGQYSWLGNLSSCSSDGRSVKSVVNKNGIIKDRVASITRNGPTKFVNKTNVVKKEKDYAEALEEQLQEEISHRQQLEELNLQLVDQMKQLKQQQIRLWANGGGAHSSGSEQSFQASSRSCDRSSSGSSSSVPIDQNTLSYIQQAFKDIYAFIKNNQCNGHEKKDNAPEQPTIEEVTEPSEMEDYEPRDHRINFVPKKVHSTHIKLAENVKINKMTKSAHLLGDTQRKDAHETKPEMIERQMGDSRNAHVEETIAMSAMYDKSPPGSVVSDSSDTLVCSPALTQRSALLNPREALYSSEDDSD